MKSSRTKAGILLATLVIPAFVFLFFKFFAKNRFDLPYYYPIVDDNDQVKIIKGDTLYNQLAEIGFINEEGKFSRIEQGQIRVISYFFTRCGTICPITNKNLARVSEAFKAENKVKLYSLTVDPVYDTPTVLAEYKKRNEWKFPNWQFLTGDKKAIYRFAIEDCKLPVSDASEYNKTITNIDDAFIHSDKVLLFDKNGYCRGIYTATDRHEIEEKLMPEIKVLLSQDK
ncbi:MAG: SCO family protein [Leadbetterella sp.]